MDFPGGLLTYWPDAGEDVPNATITAPHLYDLVRIEGQAGHPAHDIAFRGITFADTDWRLVGGSDIDVQAAVETPGAVQAHFARDCTFERCVFQRLGGYALELDRGCERDKIIGNEMHDLGAGGIRLGEADLGQAISCPCGHHVITDNHIHHIGLVNAPAVGVFVLLSGQNQIAHNEVDHTYYTAISVGWSWGYAETPCRDNVVEFNHLHDIGQGMLSDMGGVYTLGVQPGTVVRNNLIHDVNVFAYGGWGLYTDEGSSGIVLENNIVYRCQSAGFHQHYGRTNVLRNNIFAFNKESELARTRVNPACRSSLQTTLSISTPAGYWAATGGMICKWITTSISTPAPAWPTARPGKPFAPGKRAAMIFTRCSPTRCLSIRAGRIFVCSRISPALRSGFRQIDLSTVGPRAEFRRPDADEPIE